MHTSRDNHEYSIAVQTLNAERSDLHKSSLDLSQKRLLLILHYDLRPKRHADDGSSIKNCP